MTTQPPSLPARRLHKAWIILIGCILFQGGTTGILNNCLGVFYTAICTDLGFRTGDLSMYATIRSIVMALTMPFTMQLLRRYPLKLVLGAEMCGAALMLAVDWAHERGHRLRHALAARPLPLRWAVYVGAVLLVMIFGAYGDNYEPAAFIYAQF